MGAISRGRTDAGRARILDSKLMLVVFGTKHTHRIPHTTSVTTRPVAAAAAVQRGQSMNRILHRIVMGVLLVATLALFWYLLGR
jgi:hypothetical protein